MNWAFCLTIESQAPRRSSVTFTRRAIPGSNPLAQRCNTFVARYVTMRDQLQPCDGIGGRRVRISEAGDRERFDVAATERTDSELLVDARSDPQAFRMIYDRWIARILRYFYVRTLDAEVSADLAAETFAVAWTKRTRFRDVGRPVGAWLYGIAGKELSQYRRRQRVELAAVRRLGMVMPDRTSDDLDRIDEMVDATAYRQAIGHAMHGLSVRNQEALRLRVIEDLPFAEVARQLGCSEGAARVRVHRGLDHLARELGAVDEG